MDRSPKGWTKVRGRNQSPVSGWSIQRFGTYVRRMDWSPKERTEVRCRESSWHATSRDRHISTNVTILTWPVTLWVIKGCASCTSMSHKGCTVAHGPRGATMWLIWLGTIELCLSTWSMRSRHAVHMTHNNRAVQARMVHVEQPCDPCDSAQWRYKHDSVREGQVTTASGKEQ